MKGNVFNITIKKLNNEDLGNLRKVSHYYMDRIDKRIKNNAIENINNKLKEYLYEDELKIFKELLSKTGSCISGSFVLQSILQEDWENSDIDIYIPIHENFPINEFLCFFRSFRKYYSRVCGENQYMNYGNLIGIFGVIELKLRKISTLDEYVAVWEFPNTKDYIKLQLIMVDIEKDKIEKQNIFNYINFSFDLNILKNAYFGDDTIKIGGDLSHILCKRDKITYTFNPRNIVDRIRKYEKRGFKIDTHGFILNKDFINEDIEKNCDDKCLLGCLYPNLKHEHLVYPIYPEYNYYKYKYQYDEEEFLKCGRYDDGEILKHSKIAEIEGFFRFFTSQYREKLKLNSIVVGKLRERYQK